MTVSEDVAKILLKIGAVTLSPQKPYRYTSGILSPVYSDLRLLMSYPTERKKVINYLVKLIEEVGIPDVIAGTATAGIPHAAWLAETLSLPMVYVRREAKKHGKQNQIEGLLLRGQKAIVVEDLISTAMSSIETANAIRKAGGKIDHIISIFDYTLPQSKRNIKAAKMHLLTLTTFPDLVEIAIKQGYMKGKEKELVLTWLKDPETWGSRSSILSSR